MDRREFQLIEGSSKKFWAIQLTGTSFTVQFGRIGTSGQAQEKFFPTEEAAKREYDKLILEKTKKGYVEVGSNGTSAAPPAPAPAAVTKKASVAKAAGKNEQQRVDKAEAQTMTAPEPSPVSAEARVLQRTIRLSPEDRYVVTWLEHEPLRKPEPPVFDLEDGLNRLRAVGTLAGIWSQDWRKARIPAFPSPQEARFWLLAVNQCRFGLETPQVVADKLASADLDENLSIEEIEYLLTGHWTGTDNLKGCAAALLKPDDFTKFDCGRELAEFFRTHVLPYLLKEERERLRTKLSDYITPKHLTSASDEWPPYYTVGAYLGCHEEVASAVRVVPDKFFSETASAWHVFATRPQWFVFGLPNRETLIAEFKRVGLSLDDSEQACAWLALTEYAGLDVLASSVCQTSRKEDVIPLARTLLRVVAPEAALPALQISIASKAPQIGREWLFTHPLESVVGLTPAAAGSGKIAEAACEHLVAMRQGPQAEALSAALPYLSTEHQEWLQREILDNEEATLPELSHEEMPDELRNAFAVKVPALPAWLSMSPLPSIKLLGKRLAAEDVQVLLGTVKATPLNSSAPLLRVLKSYADGKSLDNFAWKLFSTWLGNTAPSKEKWAMGAIGHLGGDASVLKLTPLIREWPGESQHQRAVFGLECLRAVGSDTAMMALNGIAQKLKFKGLKDKAQAMMEEIAQARGLTREQLADCIVPDCGLDERGSRVFDFGPRQFRFVLGPEMKPLVRDAAGKVRPDLPAPNSSDDREKAEAAVADWKLLKKTLRELLKIQADRLEDAMITGRRWTAEEFDSLLVKHPLMINLVRQLIFGVYDETGKVLQSFRVTEDQTYADENDDEVEKPADGQIGIVHPAHLDSVTKGAWGQILSDYEIIPPFQQLNRTICSPDPEDLDKTAIDRYRGPKVPGIVMYGMLERSHWLRDIPADGGGFVQHSRYFPSANLTAFIRYTGMSIGYYEEPQELEQVYFVPGHVEPDWWGDHKNRLKIKDVDPVVLSEVLRLANAIISKAE